MILENARVEQFTCGASGNRHAMDSFICLRSPKGRFNQIFRVGRKSFACIGVWIHYYYVRVHEKGSRIGQQSDN